MTGKVMEKEHLKGKIEDFIFRKLEHNKFETFKLKPKEILTSNRFDLGLKLAYLTYKEYLPDLAEKIYHHDIRSQTLGEFKEYGNDEKNTFNVYIEHFDKTFNDIKNNGFDEKRSLLPLSKNGYILNGAHRAASAIFLGKEVACVKTELDDVSPNYQYFIERNVPEEILDLGAINFCEHAENIYLAFLWPSGRRHYNSTKKLFDNVVYNKNIRLNSQGGLNLLIELYKHMNWVGTSEDNFPGAHKKLLECFTDFDSFSVILFQSESLEKVQEIKKQVRDINKIGFSSIHITDTIEEVQRVAQLIFNDNGLHFLNYANPYKFKSTLDIIKCLHSNDVNSLKHMVLDGSTTLAIYGLREARDIDYLSTDSLVLSNKDIQVEPHDDQLIYHELDKNELIYNPRYHFQYLGVKFVSFDQMYIFKKNRNENKDINDCDIMKSFIENSSFKYFLSKSKQFIFYKKIVIKSKLRTALFSLLKYTNTYDLVRNIYRKLKE
ncbi:hypothetical protein VCSRO155_3294 [Vibrio cholerae]|nr:hypothetical protein [Vibrio metschnikovii]QAV03624.1 hypothetical protein FORC76_0127 [Vibrio cholerae]BCN18239.1 hypothetical protein [Vibrio cholerae]GHX01105.1 hypothetical protein VCSRO155_3294 [Vibrio cholerae]